MYPIAPFLLASNEATTAVDLDYEPNWQASMWMRAGFWKGAQFMAADYFHARRIEKKTNAALRAHEEESSRKRARSTMENKTESAASNASPLPANARTPDLVPSTPVRAVRVANSALEPMPSSVASTIAAQGEDRAEIAEVAAEMEAHDRLFVASLKEVESELEFTASTLDGVLHGDNKKSMAAAKLLMQARSELMQARSERKAMEKTKDAEIATLKARVAVLARERNDARGDCARMRKSAHSAGPSA